MTAELLAALRAEREAGAWYQRRVAEHLEQQQAVGQSRAQVAADELEAHAGKDRTRWAMDRLARVGVMAEAGDTLEQAASGLWITPDGLRSWLERNGGRDALERLRANTWRCVA